MNSAEAALLQAVLDCPEDDAARLVYADFLEESGKDPERAEMIRVQIALADSPPIWIPPEDVAFRRGPGGAHILYECHNHDAPKRRREEELLTAHGERWAGPAAPYVGPPWHWPGRFTRGFVSMVTLPLDAWLRDGPTIVRCQPVEVVRVSDREPWAPHPQLASWWRQFRDADDKSMLPSDLLDLICGETDGGANYKAFDSPEAAHAALSRACLSWATGFAPR